MFSAIFRSHTEGSSSPRKMLLDPRRWNRQFVPNRRQKTTITRCVKFHKTALSSYTPYKKNRLIITKESWKDYLIPDSLILKVEPIGTSETSVRTHRCTLCNSPEEQSYPLIRGRSLKYHCVTQTVEQHAIK
jgi:hypothetical protein